MLVALLLIIAIDTVKPVDSGIWFHGKFYQHRTWTPADEERAREHQYYATHPHYMTIPVYEKRVWPKKSKATFDRAIPTEAWVDTTFVPAGDYDYARWNEWRHQNEKGPYADPEPTYYRSPFTKPQGRV